MANASYSITFIEHPLFAIDFRELKSRKKAAAEGSIVQKTTALGKRAFESIDLLYKSFRDATYATFSHSGTSFKYVVLGYYGPMNEFKPPADIYLAVFKVAIWILGMAWCVTSTTARLIMAKNSQEHKTTLDSFGNDRGIDAEHIKSNEVALDASKVPADIQVSDLATIFAEINFTDDTKPGYMPPSTRQEGRNTIYSAVDLKTSLDTFISYVKTRHAFLGTPPAHDMPRLMDFYQQIEDAVRLTLDKLSKDMKKFQELHGKNPQAYDEKQMQQYKNLLEDRARVAIDLAIAGKHCGARFMGEAMTSYYNQYGESSNEEGTLGDNLIHLLANRRREIALGHIQKFMGIDTHSYNKYMANLGPVLAIPGTKNIIEHLDTTFNRTEYLERFFGTYTIDDIIDTVQANVKKPNAPALRVKIMEWIKDQLNNWKKDEYALRAQNVVGSVQAILNEENNDPSIQLSHFNHFLELVAHLRQTGVALPPDMNKMEWHKYLDEIFALDAAKDFNKVKCAQLKPRDRLLLLAEIKKTCSEQNLGPALQNQLTGHLVNGTPVPMDDYARRFSTVKKMEKIHKEVALPQETIERILTGKVTLQVAVEDCLDISRRREFIEEFKLENMHIEGLSDKVMEWLLVSHNILLTQV